MKNFDDLRILHVIVFCRKEIGRSNGNPESWHLSFNAASTNRCLRIAPSIRECQVQQGFSTKSEIVIWRHELTLFENFAFNAVKGISTSASPHFRQFRDHRTKVLMADAGRNLES